MWRRCCQSGRRRNRGCSGAAHGLRINASNPMFLARVEGLVVATKKDPSMSGRKLLLVRPQLVDEKDPTKFRPGANTIVAVDSVGAGIGELVMFFQGSSGRLAPNLKEAPVGAEILGIVGTVDVRGPQKYSAKQLR